MNHLCIDVGNTSIHYGLVSGQTVELVGQFPTHKFEHTSSPKFAQAVAPLMGQAVGVSYCSVVPTINENLCASLTEFAKPIFHLTCET